MAGLLSHILVEGRRSSIILTGLVFVPNGRNEVTNGIKHVRKHESGGYRAPSN